jgi:tubulin-specific chaperone E
MAIYIGQRLSFDDALCTVRYLGSLEGLKGDWLGVEWDSSWRGKHNGQHKGKQVFQCLSTSPTAASFIRPSRRSDPTWTLSEAIKNKYATPSTVNGHGSQDHDLIEISGKTVEEVGFDKIQKQLSELSALKIVLVDSMKISGISDPTTSKVSAQQELAEVFPSITELDLGRNLFETWQDIADAIVTFPKLRILKTSGQRFRSVAVDMMSDGTSPFKLVTELHLNECLLKPAQVFDLLSSGGNLLFPALKVLWLSSNELSSFSTSTTTCYTSVTTLVLENNLFPSLDCLSTLLKVFPNVNHLSLQSNQIETIGQGIVGATYPNINFLNIGDNKIPSYSFVDALTTQFPNLSSLRISKNPLYDQSNATDSTAPSDASYYLTLSRIPTLKTLNYTTITERDREDGEIYYLSVAEKNMKQILSSSIGSTEAAIEAAKNKYSLYKTLCEKYDRVNILTAPESIASVQGTKKTFPPGSLGARIVNVTFYIPSHLALDSESALKLDNEHPKASQPTTWTTFLPPSLSVMTMKALTSKHFHLPPLQFKLIYETDEFDPVLGIERTRKEYADIAERDAEWERWGDWDVDVPADDNELPTAGSNSPTQRTDKNGNVEEGSLPDGNADDGKHAFIKDGVLYHRREIEILDGMSSWGDFLGGEREVRVRIEPFASIRQS